jgi:hypothetical protein
VKVEGIKQKKEVKNKIVECRYCNSTHVTKSGRFNNRQKYHCQDCKRKFTEPVLKATSPELELDSLIDGLATYNLFGYYPESLSPKSHKLITVLCPDCSNTRNIPRYSYLPNRVCNSCKAKVNLVPFSVSKKIYPSPQAKRAAAQKRRLSTAEGLAAQRIRTLLRASFNRVEAGYNTKGGLRHLTYSAKDLHTHLAKEMEKGCCICNKPIEGAWDIAHRTPVSKAVNIKEVILLFDLENLSVAHSSCNRQLGAIDVPMVAPCRKA